MRIKLDDNGEVVPDSHESKDSFFEDLYQQEDYCDYCGYEGPLVLRTQGYKCPTCKRIVIPNE